MQKMEGEKRTVMRVVIGIAFILLSFLIYPFYGIIPFITWDIKSKVILAAVVSVISWAFFSIGIVLAGREWFNYFRRKKHPVDKH